MSPWEICAFTSGSLSHFLLGPSLGLKIVFGMNEYLQVLLGPGCVAYLAVGLGGTTSLPPNENVAFWPECCKVASVPWTSLSYRRVSWRSSRPVHSSTLQTEELVG